MSALVADIWFRSAQTLAGLATRLGWEELERDAENEWAWVIGSFQGLRWDITRLHTRGARSVDTRIFLLDGSEIPDAFVEAMANALLQIVDPPVFAGRWEYERGNDFRKVVIREWS